MAERDLLIALTVNRELNSDLMVSDISIDFVNKFLCLGFYMSEISLEVFSLVARKAYKSLRVSTNKRKDFYFSSVIFNYQSIIIAWQKVR